MKLKELLKFLLKEVDVDMKEEVNRINLGLVFDVRGVRVMVGKKDVIDVISKGESVRFKKVKGKWVKVDVNLMGCERCGMWVDEKEGSYVMVGGREWFYCEGCVKEIESSEEGY